MHELRGDALPSPLESLQPPKGINLTIPMSDALKKVIANPTDSPDPATYK